MEFEDVVRKIRDRFKERDYFYFDFDDCFLRVSIEVKEDIKDELEDLLKDCGHYFIPRKVLNGNIRYAIVVWNE